MKKISAIVLILTLSASSFTLYSKSLSPDEALSRMEKSNLSSKIRRNGDSFSLVYTDRDTSDQPSVYVFSKVGGEGFVILSAEDAAYPVLGYSEQGQFDPTDISPELSWWLGEYSGQIEAARQSSAIAGEASAASPLADLEAISPLLKSKWNQGAPYNDYCYTISADGTQTKSVTGCVATSMAQVMYYFQQPETGHGQISYKHGDSGTYTMDFGAQPFNWTKMLPTYYPDSYSQEEADAVAYLMKACGYSVKMDYGKGESGASGTAIAGALIDYFGYNPAIQVQTRAFYTYDDWALMIYDNLKNVGPVVYNGSALDGGHSFVCDGYDGNGYFHINWGWGGMSDGYYLLDALNPDEYGIGGAAGGYNLGQQVILGITPKADATGPVQLMQFGSLTGTITGSRLSLRLEDASDPGFQYINPAPITLTFGVKVVNTTDGSQTVQYIESAKKNLKAEQGSRFTWEDAGTEIDLTSLDMTVGDEYQIIVATDITTDIDTDSATAWSEVVAMPGKYNYVTIEKTADGYKLKTNSVGNITVTDLQIESATVYYDMPVKFSAEFANDASVQLTRNYSAVFFDAAGTECYKMENYSINVDADATLTQEWTSVNWYEEKGAPDITEATEFTVRLYDNWQGEYVEGIETTATVYPKPEEGKVESELTIVNGEKEGDVYEIEGTTLSVSLKVRVTEGTFNHTIMLAIQAPESSGDYFTIMHKHFDAIPDLKAGQEATYDMTVDFTDAEPDKTYRVEVWGPGTGFNEKALVRFNPEESGVESLQPDSEGKYQIYNLDGLLITKEGNADTLQTLPKGIYIVNGRKVLN